MTTFAFQELVNDPLARVEDGALGTGSGNLYVTADVGKPVKFGTANNFVACAAGDPIVGFVNSVEPYPVNGGYSFGSVKRGGRVTAKVGSDQGGTPMAVNDLVVAGAGTEALGTAGYARVKTVTITTDGDAAARAEWRCIRLISGTGVNGDFVLLERM